MLTDFQLPGNYILVYIQQFTETRPDLQRTFVSTQRKIGTELAKKHKLSKTADKSSRT